MIAATWHEDSVGLAAGGNSAYIQVGSWSGSTACHIHSIEQLPFSTSNGASVLHDITGSTWIRYRLSLSKAWCPYQFLFYQFLFYPSFHLGIHQSNGNTQKAN
jgi:hypothetical protein